MEPKLALYKALYDLVEAGPDSRGSRASRVVECVESVIRDHLHDYDKHKAAIVQAATPEKYRKEAESDGPMVWLTREEAHLNGCMYELWDHKPIFIRERGLWRGAAMWAGHLSYPGLPALAPGECRAYRLVPVEDAE